MARSERSDKNHLKRIDGRTSWAQNLLVLVRTHDYGYQKNIKFCLGEKRKRKKKGHTNSRNSEQATERAKF